MNIVYGWHVAAVRVLYAKVIATVATVKQLADRYIDSLLVVIIFAVDFIYKDQYAW